MATHPHLRLFRDCHKFLAHPVRYDAKRNQYTFDAKGLPSLRTRLRNCIASLEKQESGQ